MERPLKILMLIWEFPRKNSGGLGIAGAQMVKALTKKGVDVDVLLPQVSSQHEAHGATLLSATDMTLKEDVWVERENVTETFKTLEFGSRLLPYLPPEEFIHEVITEQTKTIEKTKTERKAAQGITLTGEYNEEIVGQVLKYALLAYQQATEESYDVVHVHDWLTFPAGTLIEKGLKLPVIFHVHSLERDRNGFYENSDVVDIEKQALQSGRHVVAVSHRVSLGIADTYGTDPSAIEVVPNAMDGPFRSISEVNGPARVGFVGRLTHQKGPNYFLDLAKELKSQLPDAKFEVIGDGYLLPELKKKAHHLNLTRTVTFTGFLPHDDVMKKMKAMDLLVVPSLSEPFGLVILEAIAKGIPVVTSPHTGVAEFVPSLPQVDNWNIYASTQLCHRLLTDTALRQSIVAACQKEAKALSWAKTADRLSFLYKEIAKK